MKQITHVHVNTHTVTITDALMAGPTDPHDVVFV